MCLFSVEHSAVHKGIVVSTHGLLDCMTTGASAAAQETVHRLATPRGAPWLALEPVTAACHHTQKQSPPSTQHCCMLPLELNVVAYYSLNNTLFSACTTDITVICLYVRCAVCCRVWSTSGPALQPAHQLCVQRHSWHRSNGNQACATTGLSNSSTCYSRHNGVRP